MVNYCNQLPVDNPSKTLKLKTLVVDNQPKTSKLKPKAQIH